MAKKDAKRHRQAVKPAKAKPRPTHSGASKEAPHRVASGATESEIRRLDREILKLANRRAALTVKWIQSQASPFKILFSPVADEHLTELIEKGNPGPLAEPAVRGLFREIISGARSQVKTLRIAYLGPAFSFTHLAAMERFGGSSSFIPVNNIAAVFEEVNRGHADYGIAPIENSTDGRVVDTLDMFTRLPLKICGEVQLAIHHNLMARCQRGEITEIYSKPQALSQCREWLSRNMPQSRLIEVTSTSTAAQLARDKFGAAAVASRHAAVQYELQVVAENIEDNKGNVTRFAVIGDETTKPTGRDKTAVLLQIPHKPGSLAEALATFKKNGINLTWIESYPLRGPEVGYLFFLDFEGHAGDARTKRMLAELERKAVRLEVLGSYPRSEPLE
ncbi:MAG: prephenate dehydratase [Planctomycetaceae bacterium]|nr:prephenate dehydratase [Planctomycetaceae bacterium]